ncbi:MAG: hypothetical protein K2Y39_20110, partial [Candidatus Obscuribacterales bacterium]|nr:hypothetical protein [Candidatus Obscuribacterales bacterium]
MESTLTWIDLDRDARDRMLHILSMFHEKESRDELGLGAVRDSFADLLFPGTSTIQTRLRYMMFIPWLYRSLEESRKIDPATFSASAAKLERDLIQPLLQSDDSAGAFGKTAGKKIQRLPSEV